METSKEQFKADKQDRDLFPDKKGWKIWKDILYMPGESGIINNEKRWIWTTYSDHTNMRAPQW